MKILITLLLLTLPLLGEPAESAWKKLVGKRFASAPEFSYPTNDPKLPNVLIYGDSISIHYHQELRKELAGKANLYRIYENGGDSSTFIPKMAKMRGTMTDTSLDDPWNFQWDVIQFNVGLHDLKYLDGKKMDKHKGKQVTSPDQYGKNLEAILEFLEKEYPEAHLIFATTTPVPEGESGRVAGDAEKYNEIARKVLKDHPEVTINDLYSLTKPNQPNWWTKPGNVHFNSKGQQAQADQTAAAIIAELAK